MKLTAQAEYGLRCILSLARAELEAPSGVTTGGSGRRALTVTEIAEREGLSEHYAGKLIRILRRVGLVKSALGRKGGYCLARPAERISVREVLLALGDKFFEPETCRRFPGERECCVHLSDCAIRALWAALQAHIDEVLSQLTLKTLLGNEQSMAYRLQLHPPEIKLLKPER